MIMIKLNRTKLLSGIEEITQGFAKRKAACLVQPVPADYCITNIVERVVNPILGTARLSNKWDGIQA